MRIRGICRINRVGIKLCRFWGDLMALENQKNYFACDKNVAFSLCLSRDSLCWISASFPRTKLLLPFLLSDLCSLHISYLFPLYVFILLQSPSPISVTLQPHLSHSLLLPRSLETTLLVIPLAWLPSYVRPHSSRMLLNFHSIILQLLLRSVRTIRCIHDGGWTLRH